MSVDGVNIKEYGAESNPDDPGLQAAKTNSKAIRDAANAAGPGGTVYVPEGEFYFGDDDIWGQTHFGDREPKGVSFVGDGPTKSKLALTEHLGDKNHWLIQYDDGHDHGTVSWQDIEVDGNSQNLRLREDYGRSGRIFDLEGNGFLKMQNVLVQNAYSDAIKNRGPWPFRIDRCTFDTISIGEHNGTDGSTGGHCIAGGPAVGETAKVTNSVFRRGARTVFNHERGLADVVFDNCWCRSFGLAFCKLSRDGGLTLRNVYHEGRTDWILNNLDDTDQSIKGRYLIQRIFSEGGDDLARMSMTDVEARSFERRAFFIYGGNESNTVEAELDGDRLAVADASRVDDHKWNSAFEDRTEAKLHFESFGELSVHDTGGAVFDTPHGTGSIDTLHRDGNAEGLGDTGDVTIGTDDAGGDPVSPDVPARSDVGIDTDAEDSPTVSWANPADGDDVSGTVTVQIDAGDAEDDDDSLTVEYRVDDGDWATTSFDADTSTYKGSWDSTTVTDGTHALKARATDSADSSSTASIEVSVDNETTLGDDWTARWESSSDDWSVVSGSSYDSGQALAFADGSGDRVRHALSWDSVGRPADVETLDKFRVPDIRNEQQGAAQARVHVRSGGSAGNEDSYWLDIDHTEGADNPTAFRLGRYVNGSFDTVKRFGNPEEGRFFYRRFRANGSELKGKVWPADESEPADWDVVVTDNNLADGWVGLGSFDPDLVETDVFSVATNGETAEFLNDDSPPSLAWVSPADGATLEGTVAVELDAADSEDGDGTLEAEYRVEGGNWTAAAYNTDTGYYEGSWDSTTVSDGDYTLEARSTDSAGNTTTATRTVTVENASAPTVNSLGVSEVETDDTDAVFDADWEVSDGDGDLSSVALVLRDGETTEDSATVGVSGDAATGTTRLVADGGDGSGTSYSVELTVTDATGMTASDTASVTETESTTNSAPTIDRCNVSEAGRPDPHAEVTVVWDVSDPDGDLASVEIDVAGSSGSIQGVTWTVSGAHASDMDSFKIMEGDGDSFDVTVTVTDEAGHSTSKSKSVSA